MNYLLDTNILCEATAREPEKLVMDWIQRYAEESYLSCVTIGEIWKGIYRLPEGKRKRSLTHWIEEIESEFSDRILVMDAASWKVWGKYYAKHEAKGFNMDVMNSIIAATALIHGLTVITINTRDFPSDCKTHNPWSKIK